MRLWEDLARQPFFVSAADREGRTARFLQEYPDSRNALVQAADAALRHEFDLLGSGPRRLGAPLPWHTDFKTGRDMAAAVLPPTSNTTSSIGRPTSKCRGS